MEDTHELLKENECRPGSGRQPSVFQALEEKRGHVSRTPAEQDSVSLDNVNLL